MKFQRFIFLIICITENNTCPIDGIKYVFGCDYDKKNLFYKESGELAFNIFNAKIMIV